MKHLTLAEKHKIETEILKQLGMVFETDMDDLPGIERAAGRKGFTVKIHTDDYFGVEFEKAGVKKSVEVPENCIQPGYQLYAACIFESCILAMRQIDKEVTEAFIKSQTTTIVYYVVGFSRNDGLTYEGKPMVVTASHFQKLQSAYDNSTHPEKIAISKPMIISIIEVPVIKDGVSMLEFYGGTDAQIAAANAPKRETYRERANRLTMEQFEEGNFRY